MATILLQLKYTTTTILHRYMYYNKGRSSMLPTTYYYTIILRLLMILRMYSPCIIYQVRLKASTAIGQLEEAYIRQQQQQREPPRLRLLLLLVAHVLLHCYWTGIHRSSMHSVRSATLDIITTPQLFYYLYCHPTMCSIIFNIDHS